LLSPDINVAIKPRYVSIVGTQKYPNDGWNNSD